MKKDKMKDLQVFAAPVNMTGDAQIQVRAREIDFVTSFGKNMQALLDVMGITRMIRKENGSVLKTKKVTGVLQSGDVAEGDEIPMSQYAVEETEFDSIRIAKYRKGVSLEAIAEKGYEAAVALTDEEFKSDLQNVVTDKFYNQLKLGSLVGHESTWQMAVAMAIGRVKDKFKKMKRTATGVAVWVNTLDVYKYIGAADITIQTAFGMDYIKNFLGADIVFVSSEIPENTVVATPLNNLVAYYVDPADSEFVKAGLSYTTDPATGFIGFHAQGNYDRAISDMFAIMGVRLFAEYLDAIAHISVGGSDTQTPGKLTVKSEAGSEAGKTKLTVEPQSASIRNIYKYKTNASQASEVTYGMDVKTWTKWDGKSEIAATEGHHITVVEADQNYKAIRSGDVVADVNPGE
nr:MAG TPA: major capsid protein [Caudoviricetes sp.]